MENELDTNFFLYRAPFGISWRFYSPSVGRKNSTAQQGLRACFMPTVGAFVFVEFYVRSYDILARLVSL